MYTVLLVDDEESVLSVLKASLDWQQLGIDTLLTASDGMEALSLFEEQTIDLLVTDIRMPLMDGIELIRNVRMLQPDTHCVLLTAYSEFSYAQEAIRLGVDNYLLKPVVREEVAQTIQSALDNVYKKQGSSESLFRDNTLRRWAAGTISAEELSERAAVLGINLYYQCFCALCIARVSNLSTAVFRAACTDLLRRYGQVYGFWEDKGRYMLILCGKTLDRERLEEELCRIAEETGAKGHAAASLGILVNSYDLLHASCQAACDALDTADLTASRVMIPLEEEAMGFDADLLGEELRVLFYESQEQIRQNGCQHLADKLYRGSWADTVFSRLCRACVHVMVQEFPMQPRLQEKIYAEIEQMKRPQTAAEGKLVAVELLHLIQTYFTEAFAQYSPMVQRMILYIRRRVLEGEEVSLKVFCAGNGVTPAYLGHMFKKETGVFFNDYLLRCRLNRSIILLRNPNRKIKDIAEAVGFTSSSYYVKCFRDYKGMSPAKYRISWGTEQKGEE